MIMTKLSFIFKDIVFDSIVKSPVRMIFATFLFLCLFGGVILFLPCCGNLSFIDAMFLSFSGVCVTGLATVSIDTNLTTLGQFFLLLLIQTGGLSIMSISSIIFLMLGKKMSLSYEKHARNIFGADSKQEVKKLLFLIFKYTFICEFIGFLILSTKLYFSENDLIYAIKHGLFLSVSAFCNAGFTLFNDNLVSLNSDSIILFTISFLIILGGIAPVIVLMFPKVLKREKLEPMALIVLNSTIALLLLGTFIFFISEYNNSLVSMNLFDKILNSWFQSVTTRTAGFNSLDLNNIQNVTYSLFLFLMIIGGSPGGMAGGVKTTTFSILCITAYNTISGRKNIIRNREIDSDVIYKAITMIMLYLCIIIIAVFILITTQSVAQKELLFETVSAMGTVGLSIGATANLDVVGKIVIILTMFLGRILPAIFICHTNSQIISSDIKYPKAKIILT